MTITNSHQKMFHCFNPLEDETVKQNQELQNSQRNINETKSLKALALLIWQRNKPRNNIETKTNNLVSSNDNKCNKTETAENAKYLFFERLGISDDCELALDEALDYVIENIKQQLTIK